MPARPQICPVWPLAEKSVPAPALDKRYPKLQPEVIQGVTWIQGSPPVT